jgi:hypothetical protein
VTVTTDERELFVSWLAERAIGDARGDDLSALPGRADKRFWLGRVAAEDVAWQSVAGDRAKRLDPCSIGVRFRPREWDWSVKVSFVLWIADEEGGGWRKTEPISCNVTLSPEPKPTPMGIRVGSDVFERALAAAGHDKGRAACVEFEVERERDQLFANVSLVNLSEGQSRKFDSNFYEVQLEAEVGETDDIQLDALPDSFRYDRNVPAFGLYCGVEADSLRGILRTTDAAEVDRLRPAYWDLELGPEPDLSFNALSGGSIEPLVELGDRLEEWGAKNWSKQILDDRQRSESWTEEMRGEAAQAAEAFSEELIRVREGIEALAKPDIGEAFRLTNLAFRHSARGRYEGWRPFQIAFVLTALPSLVDPDHPRRRMVDTLWFATGGGKTETYLAAVVFTCLLDRIRGKDHGVSAWSRFPLRMLSLQQTQRFADALAGAELARRSAGIGGDPLALGFFVGGIPNGTPNKIRDDPADWEGDAGDPSMPARHQVLLSCPFCFGERLEMRFDRRSWRLVHCCQSPDCLWREEALPFHVVDEEIYRFLPSVVIGTLDKAALISMQAAARGLYASPIAICEREGHGFVYAPRSKSPEGCLVPGCSGKRKAFDQPRDRFAPSLRVQDELHLLRDSLGAVDSHYETLLDHLYRTTFSPEAKLLASSATLAGYESQVQTLYCRPGDVFPLPGPRMGASYWTSDSEDLARRFVGLAPRGVTLDFANDRLAESLQKAVRLLLTEPRGTCEEIGIDPDAASDLLSEYGVHVVYGNKLRDVEAAARSFEQQPGVTPLQVATLTGRSQLDEVRATLGRLEEPEPAFEDRVHIVCASSMMSHGVDIDRFNVITLLGLPLATAEFIQSTARIGRRWPGLVFVLHRMGIERDASVFRSFGPFVSHGDRFIDPVAITRRSRRVLEETFAGLFDARVLGIHEARRVGQEKKNISTARALREYFEQVPVQQEDELIALCDALGIDPSSDDPLIETLSELLAATFQKLLDPVSTATFIGDVTPRKPMRSLREVETQIPIYARDTP